MLVECLGEVRMRRLVAILGAVLGVALILGGCSSSSSTSDSTSTSPSSTVEAVSDEASEAWLFVVQGSSGTYKGDEDSATLTVSGIAPDSDVIAFTDRPGRTAQRMEAADFFSRWDAMFSDSAPNMAVSLETAKDAKRDLLVVTANSASYDPKQKGGTATFAVSHLTDLDDESSLSSFKVDADKELPASFGQVDLFIDTVELRSPVVNVTSEQQFNSLINRNEYTVVVFTNEWIRNAESFHEDVEVLAQSNAGVTIAVVDTDNHPNIAQAYSIRRAPTAVAIKNGRELKTLPFGTNTLAWYADLRDFIYKTRGGDFG